jgi:GTP-binding protein EngB required for normal cell division
MKRIANDCLKASNLVRDIAVCRYNEGVGCGADLKGYVPRNTQILPQDLLVTDKFEKSKYLDENGANGYLRYGIGAKLLIGGAVSYLAYQSLNEDVSSAKTSKDFERRKREIEEISRPLDEAVKGREINKLCEEVKGKDLIVFFGETRNGKGSVVNQLIDNVTLKNPKTGRVQKDFDGSLMLFRKDASKGVPTSSGSKSDTIVPNRVSNYKVIDKGWFWNTEKDKMLIDMPGFSDNRGNIQQVANAYYMKRIMEEAENAGIVLVCSANNLGNERLENFCRLFKNIAEMFPDAENFKDSFHLIVTKVKIEGSNEDAQTYLRNRISEALNNASNDITEKGRIIAKAILDNKNISWTVKPTSETQDVSELSKIHNFDASKIKAVLNKYLKNTCVGKTNLEFLASSLGRLISRPESVVDDIFKSLTEDYKSKINKIKVDHNRGAKRNEALLKIKVPKDKSLREALRYFESNFERKEEYGNNSPIRGLLAYVDLAERSFNFDAKTSNQINKLFDDLLNDLDKRVESLKKAAEEDSITIRDHMEDLSESKVGKFISEILKEYIKKNLN